MQERELLNLEDVKVKVLEWESLVFNEREQKHELKSCYTEVDLNELYFLGKVDTGVKLVKANLIEDYYIKRTKEHIRVEKPVYTFVNDGENNNFYFGKMTFENLVKGIKNPLHKDKFLHFKYAENYDESVVTAVGVDVDFSYETNNFYSIRKKKVDLSSLEVIAIKK